MSTTTFLTVPEAAASLGLAASTLRHQIKRGNLQAHKIGRDWYITEAAVEQYRRDHKRTAAWTT